MSGTQWHLQWTNCVIGEYELQSMSRYILSSPTVLSQISLQKVSFASKEAVQLFSTIIQSQTQLLELTLDRVQLDDDDFQCVFEAVRTQLTLKYMTFTQNGHTDVIIEGIKSLLNSLPSLEKLDLRGSEDVCMELLQTAAKSMSLQVLYIPHKSRALLLEVDHLNATRLNKGLIELNVQF